MSLEIGAIVPLSVQLPDENAGLFIRATVLDPTNTPVIGSPFTLPFIEKGSYGLNTFHMPNFPWIKAIYEVFTDSGFTTLSTTYGAASDIFYLSQNGGGAGLSQVIGGAISSGTNTCHVDQPLQLVQGGTGLFDIRFTNTLTGDPLDLTSLTTCAVTLLNTDGTLITLVLGVGVSVVTPATIGKIAVIISPAQTALLQYGVVPMAVTMVIAGTTYVVQFPQSVNVAESVFS